MTGKEAILAIISDPTFREDAAERIYQSMRFERRNETPEWSKFGNSHAQVEARAAADAFVETLRMQISDMDARRVLEASDDVKIGGA